MHKPRALSCSSEGYELVTHIRDSQLRVTVDTHGPGREALAGFAPLLMGSESHSWLWNNSRFIRGRDLKPGHRLSEEKKSSYS